MSESKWKPCSRGSGTCPIECCTGSDALQRERDELTAQLAAARRLLGWVSYRSNKGCNSFKRRERDSALSDVAYHTQHFAKYWDGVPCKPDPNVLWMGESP